MNDDFVPFELAVKLEEKGFREKCLYRYRNYSKTLHPNQVETKIARKIDYSEFLKCYNSYIDNDVDAPTISQVLKWLRKEKLILIGLSPTQEYGGQEIIEWCATVYKADKGGLSWQEELYSQSYEQAALAGIEYVLDNLI